MSSFVQVFQPSLYKKETDSILGRTRVDVRRSSGEIIRGIRYWNIKINLFLNWMSKEASFFDFTSTKLK